MYKTYPDEKNKKNNLDRHRRWRYFFLLSVAKIPSGRQRVPINRNNNIIEHLQKAS